MTVRPRPIDWLLGLAECGVAALWLVSAAGKLAVPLPSYELAAAAVGGGQPAKIALAATVGVEVLLGAAAAFGILRGLWPTLGLLGIWSLVLVRVRRIWGGTFACGCFGGTATIDDALGRNALLAGLTGAVLVLAWTFGRGERGRGAAA